MHRVPENEKRSDRMKENTVVNVQCTKKE